MSDRKHEIAQFLNRVGYGSWTRQQLPNDASKRSYSRITSPDGKTRILMDAPPNESCRTPEFIAISSSLLQHGFCAPTVETVEIENGFLILSDLGPSTIADVLKCQPEREHELFEHVLEVLVSLENLSMNGLPVLTPQSAGEMIGQTIHHYFGNKSLSAEIEATVSELFATCCQPSSFLSLRDMHSENIIWREAETGINRCGLLDFQDAFLAPQGYDVMSLLRDVRREISESVQNDITEKYISVIKPDYDFQLQFSCIASQRNLRILGVFANLIRNENRQIYLPFLNRTWRLLKKDLSHPRMKRLAKLVGKHVPEPSEAMATP